MTDVSDLDYKSRQDPMAGFTKLFSTIVHSTVWREDMHVKVVWITMLAMADRNGRVLASLPGLADCARVSIEQCEEALVKFLSPDRHSRTKELEGRRIEEIDGGWRLLNHSKYREMRDEAERRLQTKEAVRRHRAKKAVALTVSQGKPRKAQAEAEADSRERKRTSVASAPAPWSHEAVDDWNARFGSGAAHGGRIGKALKPVVSANGWEIVRPAWRRYLSEKPSAFANPQDFAAHWQDWSGPSARAAYRIPL